MTPSSVHRLMPLSPWSATSPLLWVVSSLEDLHSVSGYPVFPVFLSTFFLSSFSSGLLSLQWRRGFIMGSCHVAAGPQSLGTEARSGGWCLGSETVESRWRRMMVIWGLGGGEKQSSRRGWSETGWS
jgi:hypothetical protein